MTHAYTSTACQHELHDRCRVICKFCSAPCQCHCHPELAEAAYQIFTREMKRYGIRLVRDPESS